MSAHINHTSIDAGHAAALRHIKRAEEHLATIKSDQAERAKWTDRELATFLSTEARNARAALEAAIKALRHIEAHTREVLTATEPTGR